MELYKTSEQQIWEDEKIREIYNILKTVEDSIDVDEIFESMQAIRNVTKLSAFDTVYN